MPFRYRSGEAFLQTVLELQRRKQQESQFSRDLAQKNKQMGLLQAFKNATLRQKESQFGRTQEFKVGQQEDLVVHREDVVDIQERGATTGERRADIAEEQLKINRGILAATQFKAETARMKAGDKEYDVVKIYGKAKGDLAQYKESLGWTSNTDEDALFNATEGAESLMEASGLKSERDLMIIEVKKGRSFKEYIKTLKAFREKSDLPKLSQNDEDYLKFYYDVITASD